jgi:hypothetical protein
MEYFRVCIIFISWINLYISEKEIKIVKSRYIIKIVSILVVPKLINYGTKHIRQ